MLRAQRIGRMRRGTVRRTHHARLFGRLFGWLASHKAAKLVLVPNVALQFAVAFNTLHSGRRAVPQLVWIVVCVAARVADLAHTLHLLAGPCVERDGLDLGQMRS